MPIAAPAPVFANVAFLRIPRFDGRSVVEQAGLKERLEGRVRAAIAGLPAGERIVLDAADGLALVLFGEPLRALDIAQALRGSPGEEPLQVGLNHGPIAVTARDAGAKVFGDGITAAAAASRFATPQRLLVTSPFAKMLQATRPDRAAELAPAGEFTDTRVRLHSFYTLEPQRLVARRNRLAAYALAGILGILLLGVAGREVNRRFFPPRPAMVEFDVKPQGDIFVNGLHYGRTPPLTEIELPAGPHVIQVRSADRQLPLSVAVNLEPGERMKVTHTFSAPQKPATPDSLWRDLKRKFGL